MIDYYPTRKSNKGYFVDRREIVAYHKPKCITKNLFEKYCQDGFLIIKDFFHPIEIQECEHGADSVQGLITSDPAIKAIRSRTGIHNQDPFKMVASNPMLLEMMQSLLGSDIYIHQSRINYKAGIGASGWAWHSDFETWHAQDGMKEMRCITAMIPLTENTECNGSLMVIPKSHELFYCCKKEPERSAEEQFAEQIEGVPPVEAISKFFERSKGEIVMIKCRPGDLVIFDCNLIHVSTSNMTPHDRTNLFFVYNSVENQLVEPFAASGYRPMEMGTRGEIKALV